MEGRADQHWVQTPPTPTPTPPPAQSPHVKEAEYEARAHMEGRTDAEILRSEGADLPHATKVGACC